MTRVYSHRTHQGAHRASAYDRLRAVRKKKPYKIVLEAVTQEKKKLHSILSYTANAPPGYSFVPVGHPDLTEYCKERCRKRNLDVHVVSAKPRSKAHENPEKISHHVHRIGYHFPNEVISEACDVLGYQFRNGVYSKRVHNYDETRLARSLADHGQRMLLHGRPATDTESKTQIRAAVRDLFPKIPEEDLTSIVTHAFEEGSKRVGNAMQLSLARRVQLAVVAHIRHTYTDYDQLLKTISWMEGRTQVEHVSLAKLREWRDEGDSNELEETFREVIIIDDDNDEEESSDEDSFSESDQREPSLEIVSSRATARELQHNEPDDLVWVDVRNVGRAPRRTIFLPSTQSASRSSNIARTFNAYPTEQASRTYIRPLPPAASTRPSQEYHPSLHLAHSRPIDPRSRSSVVSRPQHPLQMRGEDGQLYNLQPIVEPKSSVRLVRGNGVNSPYYTREEYAQPTPAVNPLESNHSSRFAPSVVSRRPSEQDIVLPSIERELEPVVSPRHVPDTSYHSRRDRISDVAGYPAATRDDTQGVKRKESALPIYVYDGEEAYTEQASKRPKPGYFQAEISAPLRPSSVAMPRQSRDYKDVPIRPQLPRHEVVDLTPSSPVHLPHSRSRDDNIVPTHSYITTRPSNYLHVSGRPLSSYYEYPIMEPPRAELPILRMRERNDTRDDLMRREPYRRPLVIESRAAKGNLVYGYDVQ